MKLPCPQCLMAQKNAAFDAGEDVMPWYRKLSIVCNASPIAPQDSDPCQCGAEWIPEEQEETMSNQFFVIAETDYQGKETVLGYIRKDAGPLDDWRVDSLDDKDIKVYKTETVAMVKVAHDNERVIKVHRDFLDVAAIPE